MKIKNINKMLLIVVIGKLQMLNILRKKIFLVFMLINIILKVNQIELFILIYIIVKSFLGVDILKGFI